MKFLGTLLICNSGILIVGGEWGGADTTAEFYDPETERSCRLPDLPSSRKAFTLDGTLACGLGNCTIWSSDSGAWDDSYTLIEQNRHYHNSWTPSSGEGTYILGGYYGDQTTELLKPDGSVEGGFLLRNKTRFVSKHFLVSIASMLIQDSLWNSPFGSRWRQDCVNRRRTSHDPCCSLRN